MWSLRPPISTNLPGGGYVRRSLAEEIASYVTPVIASNTASPTTKSSVSFAKRTRPSSDRRLRASNATGTHRLRLAAVYIFTGDSWLATHSHFPLGIFTHVSVKRSFA